jgi:hypothetical protein
MFKLFREWRVKRAERKARERFQAGFNFAAGALLKGATPEGIECQIEGASFFGDSGEFEDGMDAALEAYRALVPTDTLLAA